MEMKYEAVFGDQELFKGAPEYIEFIRFNDYSRELLWGDSNSINHLTFKDLKALPIVAMRRIIRTPTWTMEDQKAGRLPEVGANVVSKTGKVSEIVAIKNGYFVMFGDKSNRPITIHGDLLMKQFKPIESPEEKAQRLEDEFYQAVRETCAIETGEEDAFRLACIAAYRMILTGDLPVPGKDGE